MIDLVKLTDEEKLILHSIRKTGRPMPESNVHMIFSIMRNVGENPFSYQFEFEHWAHINEKFHAEGGALPYCKQLHETIDSLVSKGYLERDEKDPITLIVTGKDKERGERIPDYVGTWDLAFPPYGEFHLFIDEKESVKDKPEREIIKGTITDNHGHADFEGEISPTEIEFLKTYDEDSIEKYRAAPHGVRYLGKKEQQQLKYTGEFTVIQGTVEGVGPQDWSDSFEMWRFEDTSRVFAGEE